MFDIIDQLGRNILIKEYPPKRIVSLVPSQTELLHDLGLDEEVVGITKFCVHPQSWFKSKERVGGTKQVNLEKVFNLEPDLVIANKEENVKEQIEQIEKFAPVYVSDVNNLNDAISIINDIGMLTGTQTKAKKIAENIQHSFSTLETVTGNYNTCYLIWRNPHMTVGCDTFIHDMLNRCGLKNIYANEQRYPTITLEELKRKNVELILLSSEPFPFKAKHAEEIKAILPHVKILMVDGEMFSWYGSRLIYAAQYFKDLINKINKPPQILNSLA